MKPISNPALQRFAAYEKDVNLELFNAIVQLAIITTGAVKQVSELMPELRRVVWYERTDANDYFDRHDLRYMGEILERYPEKLGDTPQNLRAVALAYAFTRPIHTDNMFVGTQRADFAGRLEDTGDIYIDCARYLLADDEKRVRVGDHLLARVYERTEHLLMALCALRDRVDAFERLRPQLIRLLTKERSLPAEGNTGVYAWMLSEYRENIRASRKSDNAVPRALLKLSEGYVREKTREHAILVEAGYSPLEILILNSGFLWEQRLRSTMISPDSIPGEKLCAALITATLNADELPSSNTLEHIGWLIHSRYNRLEIKYEGNHDIWSAVQPLLTIQTPEILMWMVVNLKREYDYRFDVLDHKWDVLAANLAPEIYHPLFRRQLIANESASQENIQAMLDRYASLTGKSYMEVFNNFTHEECDAFMLMVRHGLIDMWAFFTAHQEERGDRWHCGPIDYLWPVINGVNSSEAFHFWRRFFENHSLQEVPGCWARGNFHEAFYAHSRYSARHMNCLRPYLSREENRLLCEWIDQSAYAIEPKGYDEFVIMFLSSADTWQLYDAVELRPVFDCLIERYPNRSTLLSLKPKFLSEAELQEDRAAIERARMEREQAERMKYAQSLAQETDEAYDGTIKSLVTLVDRSGDWRDQRRIILQHVHKRLPEILDAIAPLNQKEIANLLFLCGWFVRYDLMSREKALALAETAPCATEEEGTKAC